MVTATSQQQFDATLSGAAPATEMVRDNLWAVGMPMPPGQPGTAYSLTYVLRDRDGRLHLVDTGWDTERNRAHLAMQLNLIGGEVATVTVTHYHPDHIGLAHWLQDGTGARIRLHRADADAIHQPPRFSAEALEAWGVPSERADEILGANTSRPPSLEVDEILDFEVTPLRIPGWNVVARHTPGHSAGHLVVHFPDDKLIMTGDTLLPTVFAGVGLGGTYPENAISLYFRALGFLEQLDDHEALPGHGYRFRGILERARETRAHHTRRSDEVAAALAHSETLSVWDIASRLTWTRGFDALKGPFLWSALHQTSLHVEFVREHR